MDHDQVGSLYEAHFEHMVRLAFVLTGSESAAEDIAQEAFVSLHRKIDGVASPIPYLRKCVVNACRTWHRRRHREQSALKREAFEPAVDPDVRELLDVLNTLSPRQRAVVILRYYEGMRIEDIARVLRRPTGTIKSDISRALSTLRKEIGNDEWN